MEHSYVSLDFDAFLTKAPVKRRPSRKQVTRKPTTPRGVTTKSINKSLVGADASSILMDGPLQNIYMQLKTSYIRGVPSTVASPYNLKTAQKNRLSTVMDPSEASDHQPQQADTVNHNLDSVSPTGAAGVGPQTELQAIILNEKNFYRGC